MKHNFIHRLFFQLGSLFLLVLAVLSSVQAVIHTQTAHATGDDVLAPSLNHLVRGDVVSSGIGLRRTGSGTLTMTQIPSGSSVYHAYLYWATLGSSNNYTNITLNNTQVHGDLIGTTNGTCWPDVEHNFAYRADVTAMVQGNGSYTIAGLPNLLRDGNDSQGASLVVIYTHPTASYRQIVINDGAVGLNTDVHSYRDTLSGFINDNPVTQAHITYVVGDGQPDWSDGDVLFNGTSLGSNVFTGSNGNYWDTLTFNVTTLVQNASVTTEISNLAPQGPSPDCLLWVASVFSITRPQPGYDEFLFLPVITRQ